MDESGWWRILYIYLVFLTASVEAACPNTAGVVLGSIFGTLLVVAIVLGIIAFIWRRRNKTANKKPLPDGKGYTNQTFSGDVEMQAGTRPNGSASRDQAADIPAAYVECKEYDSPNKDQVVSASREKQQVSVPKAKRNILDHQTGQKGGRTLDLRVCRTGSSGSLDAAITPNDPEVISVSLQSSDIIGLGFNISGSLSEGIFVSQVHNRGPASESGKIKVGDRILSITISMENMVYEDALTILSYASPYPVRLKLQRAMPVFGDSSDDEAKLSHPVYRSQSLDDLNKLHKDKWSGPRKTWSEMRRVHPAKEADIDGRLKKWSGTNDIVQEEIMMATKVEQSHEEPEILLQDTTEAMVHSAPGLEVLEVDIPETDTVLILDENEHGVKRKSDVPDVSLNIDDSGVVMEPPPKKKSRDSCSEDEIVSNGDGDVETSPEKYKMYEVDLNVEQPDDIDQKEPQEDTYIVIESETDKYVSKSGKLDRSNSVSSKGSVSSLSNDSIDETQHKTTADDQEGDDKLTVADINENKITISQEYLEEHISRIQDTDVIHVSDSLESKDLPQGVSEMKEQDKEEVGTKTPEKQVKAHEDSVRAVLKDYFGDQPSLLEQFGFDSQKAGKGGVQKTVEVTTITKDGEAKTTKTEGMEPIKVEDSRDNGEGASESDEAARSRNYQYNKGNKGGMAYYLRIDEGFGGDDGLFGHAYNLNKEQPNLIPVGSETLTTSKTTKIQSTMSSSDDKAPLVNGPQAVISVEEQASTSAEA